jgi:hypothetical protein
MADIPVKIYRSTIVREGTQPSNPGTVEGEVFPPVNPPGSGFTTTYKQLGDVTDQSFVGKNGFVPVVNSENVLTLEPLPNGQADGLISGGIVQWTGTGYQFNVSSALARFQGVFPLQSDFDILTLTTADATNPRIDLFILQILFDGNGIPNGMEADFITGTPSATPSKPQINPQTQIELTQVLVPALSTTPTLTDEMVYDENIEWTGTSSGTGTANFASAVNPYVGSVSVETTNIQNGFYIQFNNGSEIDITDYQTIGFFLALKASMGAGQNITLQFLDASFNPIGRTTFLTFDKSVTTYQFIALSLSSIPFTSNLFQYIRFYFVRTGGSPTYSGYFLDLVKLEGGINPPVQFGTFLSLGDTPSSYSGQGGKSVAVKSDESGLEFVTGGGGGGVQSVTGDGVDNTDPDNPVIDLDDIALSGSPYDLAQEGASDGDVLTWVAANSRFEPVAPSGGGGSNWTVVGSDIYRNSNVAIGRTSIPSNGTGLYTFTVQSKVAGSYFLLESSAGVSHMIANESGLVQVNPTGINGAYLTFGNISSFSGGRGIIARPTAAGYSIITTDQAGTLARFAIADTGTLFLNGLASFGAAIGTTINAWGTGIRGASSGIAARKSFLVQNAAAVEHFYVSTNGEIGFSEGGYMKFGATTGFKMGITTSDKFAFWNKTPIIQPTTSIIGATKVGGGGTTVTDTDTFGGYTLQQIAAALINTGLLA